MRRGPWADAAIAVLLAILAVALHAIAWDRGFVLLDEGYVATIADLLHRGGALYRDAVTYVLPGAYAVLAGAFALAGESLRVGRALTIGLVAVLVLAAYRVARAGMSAAAATLGVAGVVLLTAWSYPQWQVYGYQQPGIVAVVLAAALLAAPQAGAQAARTAVAGLLVGGAVCTKQTNVLAGAVLGVFVVADVLLQPGPRRRRGLAPVLAYAVGAAVPVLATLAFLAGNGTFGDFWVQGVLSPLHGAGYLGYVGLPALSPLFGQDERLRSELVHYVPPLLLELRMPAIADSRLYRDTALFDVALKLLYWLPALVPAAAVLRLAGLGRRARRLPGDRAWPAIRGGALLLALAVALLAATNRPLDWMHVALPWIGTMLLGVWLLAPGERPSRGVLALLLVPLLALLGLTLDLLVELRGAMDTPVGLPRVDVAARAPDARVLGDLVRSLQRATGDGEPILVVPYHPLVYFAAERPPASRFLFTWPVEYQAGRDREMLDAIDRLGVRSVVHGTATAPQLGTIGENAPLLLEGLVDRFRVAEVFGAEPWGIAFLRLEPRPPLPEGSVVLEAGAQAAGVRRAIWPFERVLAVELVPGGAREVLVPVPASEPGELVLGYGVNPDRWVAERPVALVFEAALERDGETQPLFRERRDPQGRVEDRAWPQRRIAVDGRAATLVLRVEAPGEASPEGDVAGWAVPRLEPATSAPR